MESLLNVTKSFGGYCWQLKEADSRLATTLAQRLDLPEVVARILAARGVTLEDAPQFLNPSIRDQLPDPSQLKDMDAAASRIADTIMRGGTIGIFGDYDVDGATSSALLRRYFGALGIAVLTHIPDRFTEGYGPNAKALLRLKELGADVVITVDCGISAYEPLAEAKANGLDVIVMDHHLGEARLPEAVAIVNPNRFDENRSLGHLAAVGVCFLFMVAIQRELRNRGFFNQTKEPNLLNWLDIVALGTVCDVVPLKGLNRAFVSRGLQVMARRQNAGIRALMEIAGVNELPDCYHAGFLLGPRINAGGRVGESYLGSDLLASDDAALCGQIAAQLNQYNAERQAIEAQVLEEATAQMRKVNGKPHIYIAHSPGWHEGVIGIVAGRLKDRLHRPVAVLAVNDNHAKASARSIAGVDIGAAIHAAKAEGLLTAGGGHAMAGGFTVEREKIEPLGSFWQQHLTREMEACGDRPRMTIDAVLSPGGLSLELAQQLQQLGPFGAGNPTPKIVVKDAYIGRVDWLKGVHARVFFGDSQQDSLSARWQKGMAFRAGDSAMGDMLRQAQGQRWHLAGTLKTSLWQGTPQMDFIIDDAAMA